MANKWQRQLIALLMRSLDETPYDWTFRDPERLRNEHLKISITFRRGRSSASSLRVWFKGEVVIDRAPHRFFMGAWRPRLILAMQAAEKNAEIARAAQAVEDTLEPLDAIQSTARMLAYMRAQGVFL